MYAAYTLYPILFFILSPYPNCCVYLTFEGSIGRCFSYKHELHTHLEIVSLCTFCY